MAVVFPMPNWPYELPPQHFISPLSKIAQACQYPVVMATAVRPVPRSTAARLSPISSASSPMVVVFPMPNSPFWFLPQHFTSPLSRRAQENWWPTETSTAVRPVPRSTVERLSPILAAVSPMFVVFPIPNCPWPLKPQHFTVPSSRTAHVCGEFWSRPADIDVAVRPVPRFETARASPISPALSPMFWVAKLPRRPW